MHLTFVQNSIFIFFKSKNILKDHLNRKYRQKINLFLTQRKNNVSNT